MRSFEDRWLWLRATITEDHAAAQDLADATADPDRSTRLHGQVAAFARVLGRMDDADRNGPGGTI